MLRHFLAAAAALIASSAATATPAQHAWAGFYGGVEAGVRHSRYDFSWTDDQNRVAIAPVGPGLVVVPFNTVSSAGRVTGTDAVYGGLIGWSGQSGRFVYGLEASAHLGGPSEDVSYKPAGSIGSANSLPFKNSLFERHLRTRFESALRARVGYAFGGTLLYVAGGVAGQRLRIRVAGTYNSSAATVGTVAVPDIGPIVTGGSQSRNFIGWTAGGGIERHITRHFSIGVDARYDQLSGNGFTVPNQTTTSPPSSFYGGGAGAALPAPPTSMVRATGHEPRGDMEATVRLVYHF